SQWNQQTVDAASKGRTGESGCMQDRNDAPGVPPIDVGEDFGWKVDARNGPTHAARRVGPGAGEAFVVGLEEPKVPSVGVTCRRGGISAEQDPTRIGQDQPSGRPWLPTEVG